MAKHLRKENLDTVFCEFLDIGARFTQCGHIADRDAVNALLNEHFGAAVIPINIRHIEHVRTGEVAFQLCRIGGLTHEVEFVDDRLLILRDDLERAQTLAVLPVAGCETGNRAHDVEILFDLLLHARAQQLDDDFMAVMQLRGMNLCNRRRGERLGIEALEHFVDRLAIGCVENLDSLLGRKRRDLILQLCQLVSDIGWQQVAAC